MQELQKIAVVIDADNTQISKLEDVFHEISTRGRIVVKRAYGNWHKPTLKNWGEIIKRLAIKAEQQFDYVSGKNATDMALVIDTIELLYTNLYDAFVIVSSDSDYTPLAIKLREAGVYVMGVGEQKTPVAFRNACDEFLFLENCSSSVEGTMHTMLLVLSKAVHKMLLVLPKAMYKMLLVLPKAMHKMLLVLPKKKKQKCLYRPTTKKKNLQSSSRKMYRKLIQLQLLVLLPLKKIQKRKMI